MSNVNRREISLPEPGIRRHRKAMIAEMNADCTVWNKWFVVDEGYLTRAQAARGQSRCKPNGATDWNTRVIGFDYNGHPVPPQDQSHAATFGVAVYIRRKPPATDTGAITAMEA